MDESDLSDYSFDDTPPADQDAASDFSFDDDTPKLKPPAPQQKQRKPAKTDQRHVPFESVFIPTADTAIDKLLSWRVAEDECLEFLVKYKNSAYYHAEWISRETVERASKTGKSRVKKFIESKPLHEIVWSEDDAFNPSFLKIDRIIDQGEMHGELYCLVKWCSQSYDESTWETEELVMEIDPDKIDEYLQRNAVPDDKQAKLPKAYTRPNASEWKKIEASPVYKGDNQLRSYQLEGLNWLLYCWYHGNNSILADEMGLGKTVQSTAFINHLQKELHLPGPFLIITPLSTIGNWEREIRTWTDMNLIVYHGKDTARNLCVDSEFYFKDSTGAIDGSRYKFDVVLTTYEMAMSGIAQLKPIHWRACIIDEAHKLKNKASKISELLKQYKFDHKVLLTGTPLQNSLDELWSLLNFLSPQEFADERVFQAEYGSLTTASDVEKLQLLLKPLMLRRLKEDVEKTIPVKEETIIEVELTTIQKKWYRSILERNFSWLKQGTKKNNVPNLVNTMMELRKCCIHPFLLKGAEDSICDEYKSVTHEQHFKVLIASSGKMVLIDKLLRKLKAGGHKVLLFSQMTKCLDIIQDYLKGMQYGFERIDGGVRGDLRQAAIDRFSAPNSESFVFLLCTRAGGVGINLTVADTDSDWNPQNDLQAQARCHRIGQKKSVQIYRLVMRNTYEREMLDRASMKLGLDKAVLQRMDAGSTLDPSDNQPMTNGLSKAEIESLLKRGAYHAFIDDEASTAFLEEDIDQILERRTQKITHDNSDAKGSIFSKASFTANASDDIDINAVDFWEQVAKKAQFEISDELEEGMELIIDEPRHRRQVLRFGKNAKSIDEEASDDDVAAVTGEKKTAKAGPDDPKPWTVTERTRFERNLMLFGFGGISQGVGAFPRRTVEDLRAVSRLTIGICLQAFSAVPLDVDVVADMQAMLALEHARLVEHYPESQGIFDIAHPYPNADQKKILEYKSYLDTAAAKENIERKSKNLLGRLQMLFTIRIKIAPTPELVVPIIPSSLDWWHAQEDRDLLIGILKHGYGQYDKIRYDPDLCFYLKYVDEKGDYRLEPGMEYEVESSITEVASNKTEVNGIKPVDAMDVDAPAVVANSSNAADADIKTVNAIPALTLTPVDAMQIDTTPSITVDHSSAVKSSSISSALVPHLSPTRSKSASVEPGNTWPVWPTASELGIRVRKIIAAFARQRNSRDNQRSSSDKQNKKTQKELDRLKLRERDLSRKEKIEFIRVLMSFGVEHDPEDLTVKAWGRFKELAGLAKKPDETMNEYYEKMIKLAHECVERGDAFQKEIKENDSNAESTLVHPTNPIRSRDDHSEAAVATAEPLVPFDQPEKLVKFNPYVYKIENDGDVLAYEKAKRMIKRVEVMRTLREVVLTHSELDERLYTMKKHQRTILPDWWLLKYDKYFLHGLSRWGIGRSDLIIEDATLPFKKLNKEYQKLTTAGEDTEKFWMKEQVALKRFDLCMEAVLNPFHISGKQPEHEEMPKLNLMATRSQRNAANHGDNDGESDGDEASQRPIKVKLNYDDNADMVEYAPKKRKKREQPDGRDPSVTLEEMLSFNKKLSVLYSKEYEMYKPGAMLANQELIKGGGVIRQADAVKAVQPVITEYSEGSDGECVESTKKSNAQ